MRREGIQRLPTRSPRSDALGIAYERQLAKSDPKRAARRSRGIYYTPSAVVDYIVEQTLDPLLAERATSDIQRLRLLDPACGCGAFLLGAYRWLCRRFAQTTGKLPTKAQRQALVRCLAGIDIDPDAVKLAREALANEADISAEELTDHIRVGDALLEHDEWFAERFDAIVMNPPYVNVRRLTHWQDRARVGAYRQRYRCASGAFDLYVLFLERSITALVRGGRLGAIVPNKLATLDYARPCRELLLSQGRLDEIVDVSQSGIFGDANVYPYILHWTKTPAAAGHAIRVLRPLQPLLTRSASEGACRATSCQVLQSELRPDGGLVLGGDLDVESRAATVPLADVCTIHSGATGFQAAELAARLTERSESLQGNSRRESATFDFVVSGNIDRYCVRPGPVRFMGQQFKRPVLAADDPLLTVNKRRLYAGDKIVLAGMVRRLEAAFDTRGLALGVQVYALADWKINPLYLLGLLNSSLLSHLFRLRFAAKRLAGGYFSLSKRQLGQLPIRSLDLRDRRERRVHDRLVDLAGRRLTAADVNSSGVLDLDGQIDELVLSLYRVTSQELAFPAAA